MDPKSFDYAMLNQMLYSEQQKRGRIFIEMKNGFETKTVTTKFYKNNVFEKNENGAWDVNWVPCVQNYFEEFEKLQAFLNSVDDSTRIFNSKEFISYITSNRCEETLYNIIPRSIDEGFENSLFEQVGHNSLIKRLVLKNSYARTPEDQHLWILTLKRTIEGIAESILQMFLNRLMCPPELKELMNEQLSYGHFLPPDSKDPNYDSIVKKANELGLPSQTEAYFCMGTMIYLLVRICVWKRMEMIRENKNLRLLEMTFKQNLDHYHLTLKRLEDWISKEKEPTDNKQLVQSVEAVVKSNKELTDEVKKLSLAHTKFLEDLPATLLKFVKTPPTKN